MVAKQYGESLLRIVSCEVTNFEKNKLGTT